MGGKAKSVSRKNREERAFYESLVERAASSYQAQTARKKLGFRQITQQTIDEYKAVSGRDVKLSWTTVRARVLGKPSLTESRAAERCALTPAESEKLLQFLHSCARSATPFWNPLSSAP